MKRLKNNTKNWKKENTACYTMYNEWLNARVSVSVFKIRSIISHQTVSRIRVMAVHKWCEIGLYEFKCVCGTIYKLNPDSSISLGVLSILNLFADMLFYTSFIMFMLHIKTKLRFTHPPISNSVQDRTLSNAKLRVRKWMWTYMFIISINYTYMFVVNIQCYSM